MKENARKEVQYHDRRSGRVVFVSHCLLNCNAKFPGSADVKGVYTDLIHPVAEAGVGIIQMSCLEIMGWGGVDRPLVIKELSPQRPNEEWIINYPQLCTREALKVVDQMEDYRDSGYDVLGVIYVSDSPTCGLTDTLTFPDVHFQMMEMDIPQEKLFDLEYKKGHVWPKLTSSGTGAFVYPMQKEVRERGLDIPFSPFKPSNPRQREIKRIFHEIGLVKN